MQHNTLANSPGCLQILQTWRHSRAASSPRITTMGMRDAAACAAAGGFPQHAWHMCGDHRLQTSHMMDWLSMSGPGDAMRQLETSCFRHIESSGTARRFSQGTPGRWIWGPECAAAFCRRSRLDSSRPQATGQSSPAATNEQTIMSLGHRTIRFSRAVCSRKWRQKTAGTVSVLG